MRDPLSPAQAVPVIAGQAKICDAQPPVNNGARSLDASADGRLLTATRADAIVAVFGTAPSGELIDCLKLKDGDRNSITVAFSTDSRALAVLTPARVSIYDLSKTEVPIILGAVTGTGATSDLANWIDWYDADRLLIARENRVVQLDLRMDGWMERMDSVLMKE
jgi:hypothetical protein